MRKPVIIAGIGNAYGRDAIFLDEVVFNGFRKVVLVGEFNGSLCSEVKEDKYIKYELIFSGIQHFQSTELDFYEGTHSKEYCGSFEEIEESELIQEFKRINTSKIHNHRHFVFWTYDDVIEVVADNFNLQLRTERPKKKASKYK